jgi:hypothetical protein
MNFLIFYFGVEQAFVGIISALIALAYGMIDLVAGSVRGYTGKSVVELLTRA